MFFYIIIAISLEFSLVKTHLKSSTESEEARKWFDLVELGSNISQVMDHPTGPGHKFVRDLFVYWENLEYVLNSLRNNETRGMDVYERLKSDGGPKHADKEIKDDLLLKSFNWTQRDIKEIHGIVNDTKEVWSDIQTYLKEN